MSAMPAIAAAKPIKKLAPSLPSSFRNSLDSSAVKSGADGIKLQLLHVLKGTDLEHDWREGKFETLSVEEYIEILEGCVRRLPPNMTIHRLTGDGDKKSLLGPLWSADKKRVLNAINEAFRRDNVTQGELYEV